MKGVKSNDIIIPINDNIKQLNENNTETEKESNDNLNFFDEKNYNYNINKKVNKYNWKKLLNKQRKKNKVKL